MENKVKIKFQRIVNIVGQFTKFGNPVIRVIDSRGNVKETDAARSETPTNFVFNHGNIVELEMNGSETFTLQLRNDEIYEGSGKIHIPMQVCSETIGQCPLIDGETDSGVGHVEYTYEVNVINNTNGSDALHSPSAVSLSPIIPPVVEDTDLQESALKVDIFAKALEEARKPEAAKSVSGYLAGCLQSYLSKPGASTGTIPLERSDTVYGEVTILPDGLKQSTDQANPLKLKGRDFDAIVEWGKAFSFNLAFAVQQRQVVYLKICVYSTPAVAPGKPASSAVKRLVGTCLLDVASLVMLGSQPIVVFLPVRDTTLSSVAYNATNAVGAPTDIDVVGWACVGLNCQPSDVDQTLASAVTRASLRVWRKLKPIASLQSIGWASAGSEPSLQLVSTSVHIALTPLRTLTPAASDLIASGDVISLHMSVGGESMRAYDFVRNCVVNDRLAWDDMDKMLFYTSDCDISDPLTLSLRRCAIGSTSPPVPVAETVMILPRTELQLGLPLNMNLPLRDKSGARLCTITMCVHMTALGCSPTVLPAPSTSTLPSLDAAMICLNVTVDEGSVSEDGWRLPLEPFFECTIVQPSGETFIPNAVSGFVPQSRTNFLPAATKPTSWGLQCGISFPAVDIPREPMQEVKAPKWALVVVARDAARGGCPEVGYAKISLPWSLISRERPVDQWITLASPQIAGQQSGAGAVAGVSPGRLRLKISKVANLETPPVFLSSVIDRSSSSHPGLGTVVFWIKEVLETKSGQVQEKAVITMATASATVDSQTVPDDPHDTAASAIRFADANTIPGMIMALSSSSDPATNLEPCSVNIGTIPVSSGHGTVHFTLGTLGNKVPLVTSFPVISALTAACSTPESYPPIPTLDLPLSASQSDAQGSRKVARRPPRLKVDAVFVPFVKGQLVIALGAVRLHTLSAKRFTNGPRRQGMFRYLLASSLYTYSSAVDLIAPTDPGAAGKLLRPDTTVLTVDTMSEAAQASSMELIISLYDLDSTIDGGSGYVVGRGTIQTATIYYQAMRAAAASGLPATIAKGDIVGSSAWMPCEVELIDPIQQKPIATVTISLQYVVESIAAPVLSLVGFSRKPVTGDAEARARVELGLKQAFTLADADGTGSVSSTELFTVVQATTMAKKKKTASPVGMEDAVALLLSLAGPEAASVDPDNPEQLAAAVDKVFKRLDVDGDGSISWWEWKNVLASNLSGRHPDSRFVDPMDVLSIGIAAAHDALKARPPGLTDQLAAAKAGSDIPFLPLTAANNMPPEAQTGFGYDPLIDTLPPSKAMPLLQNVVKTLKGANSTLLQRLEKALQVSQQVVDGAPASTFFVPPPPGSGAEADIHRTRILQAERKLLEIESQRSKKDEALSVQMRRTSDLEAEVARLKAQLGLVAGQKEDKDKLAAAARDQLLQEQEKINSRIKGIQELKKLKMKATVLIVLFLRKKVLPMMRKRRYLRDKNNLAHVIRGAVVRKQYKTTLHRRHEAANSMQKLVRGRLHRKLVKNLHIAAQVIQCAFRAWLGRRLRQAKMLQVLAKLKYKRALAAIKIQCFARIYFAQQFVAAKRRERKKGYCARVIQRAVRGMLGRQHFAHVKSVKLNAFAEIALLTKQKAAALKLQSLVRGRSARKSTAQLKAERLKTMQHMAFASKRDRAAIIIQARVRIFLARLAVAGRREDRRKHAHKGNERNILIRRFKDIDQRAVENQHQPQIEACAEELLKFNYAPTVAGSHKEQLLLERYSSSSTHRWGHVTIVEPVTRLLTVEFFDAEQVELYSEIVPYDHPRLQWYYVPGGEIESVSESNSAAASTVNGFETIRPDIHQATNRYLVGLMCGSSEDVERVGEVQSVDLDTRIMAVVFSDTKNKEVVEHFPYDHPFLVWFQEEEKVNNYIPRPSVDHCTGCTVKVRFAHIHPQLGSSAHGVVMFANVKSNTVCVRFDVAAQSTPFVIEEFPHKSKVISWVARPQEPGILSQSLVSRPATKDSLGYYVDVEVRAYKFIAESDATQRGEVISVNPYHNTIEVRLREDSLYPATTIEIAHNSHGIHWIAPPVDFSLKSTVARPFLEAAVGYKVSIKSPFPDSDIGNCVPGIVEAVDPDRKTMRILIGSAPNNEMTIDDVSYDNIRDIAWVELPVKKATISIPIKKAVGYSVNATNFTNTERKQSQLHGVISRANRLSRTLTMLTLHYHESPYSSRQAGSANSSPRGKAAGAAGAAGAGAAGAGAADVPMPSTPSRDIPHDLLDVSWVNESARLLSISLVDKPALKKAVGYTVYISSRNEVGYQDGDFYAGIVESVNEATHSVNVRLESTDPDAPGELEVIEYGSSDVAWMMRPIELMRNQTFQLAQAIEIPLISKTAESQRLQISTLSSAEQESPSKRQSTAAARRPSSTLATIREETFVSGSVAGSVSSQPQTRFEKGKLVIQDRDRDRDDDLSSVGGIPDHVVQRPPIKRAVGHRIEMRHSPDSHIDALEELFYSGVVAAINTTKHTVIVKFDVEDEEEEKEGSHGHVNELEEVPYDSSLLRWVVDVSNHLNPDSPVPSISTSNRSPFRRSMVSKPDLAYAVGYGVEVKDGYTDDLRSAHQQQYDDYSRGIVRAINTTTGTITVRFDVAQESDVAGAYEELSYASSSVLWMTEPVNTVLSSFVKTPAPAEAAIGYIVEVLIVGQSDGGEGKEVSGKSAVRFPNSLDSLAASKASLLLSPKENPKPQSSPQQQQQPAAPTAARARILTGRVSGVDAPRGRVFVYCEDDVVREFIFSSPRLAWVALPPADPKKCGIVHLPMEIAQGCKVIIHSSVAADGGKDRVGYVLGYNNIDRRVMVSSDKSSYVNVLEISYDDLAVLWDDDAGDALSRSFVPRPPIKKAVGYTVELEFPSQSSDEVEYAVAVVSAAHPEVNMISIRFQAPAGTMPVYQRIPYDSTHICWMAEPLKSIARSLVLRPPIDRAVGYTVETKSTLPEAEEGDFFAGVVQSVVAEKKLLLVRFHSVHPTESDVETLDYSSDDICWMAAPETAYSRSAVPRPPIDKAIGYTVEVQTRTGDSEDDEFFLGIVSSIHTAQKMIVVRFSEPHAEHPDEDRLPYDSEDIAWMASPVEAINRSVVARPPMERALGYTVEVHSTMPDAEEGEYFAGIVHSVNTEQETLQIRFNVTPEDSLDIETRPFYSDEIAWIAAPPNLIERSVVPRPPIWKSLGYTVEVRSTLPDAEEGEYFTGIVQSVQPDANSISVRFHTLQSPRSSPRSVDRASYDQEVLVYDSEEMAWMAPPRKLIDRSIVPRPPIHASLGYTVEVKSSLAGAEEDEYFVGIVQSIQVKDKSICVRFHTVSSPRSSPRSIDQRKGNEDTDTLPYASDEIAWMAPPQKTIDHSLVPRPPMQGCLGYTVEVKSTSPDAEAGDRFAGIVYSVQHDKNTICIRFPTDSRPPRPSSSSAPASSSVAAEDDEIYPYGSDDVAWIAPPAKAISLSVVERPALEDAVGYHVETPSTLLTAHADDFFPGTIVAIDIAKETVVVHYEGHSNEGHIDGESDNDVLPYLSEDIAWMKKPESKVTIEPAPEPEPTTAPKPEAEPKNEPIKEAEPKAVSQVPRPPLENCIGYTVEVPLNDPDAQPGDFCPGLVTAVDVDERIVVVHFDIDADTVHDELVAAAAEDKEEHKYDSADILWMAAPDRPSAHLSTVPRPPITKAIGYHVEVQNREPGGDPSEFYAGTVHSFNADARTLVIKFLPPDEEADGAQSQDQASNAQEGGPEQSHEHDPDELEELAYLSSHIVWIARPSPPTHSAGPPPFKESSPVSTPALTPAVKLPPKQYRWDDKDSKQWIPKPEFAGVKGKYIKTSMDGIDLKGKVVDVVESGQILKVQFYDDNDELDPDPEDVKYTAPMGITWFTDKA